MALYIFISVAAVTTLFLAAVITERNTAAAIRDDALEQVEGAARRSRFLAEASRILASGLDYDTTIANVARLVVPMLGDNCVVDVIAEDGSIRRVTEASTDPARGSLVTPAAAISPWSVAARESGVDSAGDGKDGLHSPA